MSDGYNRYYKGARGSKAIPEQDGLPAERFLCRCGASLMSRDRVGRFRPPVGE